MKLFIISATGFLYEGLFTDSCAALLDAMSRFPEATRISVRLV